VSVPNGKSWYIYQAYDGWQVYIQVHWTDDEKRISVAKSTRHPNVDGRSIAVAARSWLRTGTFYKTVSWQVEHPRIVTGQRVTLKDEWSGMEITPSAQSSPAENSKPHQNTIYRNTNQGVHQAWSTDMYSSTIEGSLLRCRPRSLPQNWDIFDRNPPSKEDPWSQTDGHQSGLQTTIAKSNSIHDSMPIADTYWLQDILSRACGSTGGSSDRAGAVELGK